MFTVQGWFYHMQKLDSSCRALQVGHPTGTESWVGGWEQDWQSSGYSLNLRFAIDYLFCSLKVTRTEEGLVTACTEIGKKQLTARVYSDQSSTLYCRLLKL